MSDTQETHKIRELQKTKDLLSQVTESLNSQKAFLKQHGMSLPPMVTMTLANVQENLTQLETTLLEEQTELSQLQALADMSAKITTSLDVDTVLEEAMDIVIVLTKAERGYIILLNQQTGRLIFRVSRDDALGGENSGKVPQVSTSVIKQVITTQEALLADNAYQDERLQRNDSIANFTLRSVLCVPLMYRGQVLGVVYVDNRLQAGVFREREKNTLIAFANTAAVAFANARLFADIQRSLHDITRYKNLMDNVFASVGSGVIATDATDLITTFNRAAERIFEVPAQEIMARSLSTVLPRITVELTDHLEAVRENNESQTLDIELATIDKKKRKALSLKLAPLKDAHGTTRGIAMVVDDVTEKVAREQELRVMKTYLPPEMVDNIHEISNLALGGEKREVTCIFAEILPLHLLKAMRPQEVMDLMNIYLDIATDCVHDTQGVVDKYMGNEVMALYNTQLNPQQNHAWLAIEGALMMRDLSIALYARLGIDPNPHYYNIGVHTGNATLGNVGSLNRRDFTAIGDTINLSKRLQENASAGQIIVSESTIAHLENSLNGSSHQYRFVELDPIQVKGRRQQTRIFEVFRN